MKAYVLMTTAAMNWVKDIFTVIIATVAKRKRCYTGQFHVKLSRACHPYFMDFLGVFTSGRYHRDMKILKILASNSKQIDDIGGGGGGGEEENTTIS